MRLIRNGWYHVPMIILGLDPGIGRTGWGIIARNKNTYEAIDYGCIETEPNSDMNLRLLSLHQDASAIIKKFKPDLAVVEELFFNTNAKTALVVGQARGVILLTCTMHKVETVSFTPLQVKMALAGYGRAEKSQVAQMVKTLLSLPTIPKPDDVTDALAAALTGGVSYRSK